MPHKPVLIQEVLDYLKIEAGDTVLDGTLGRAGHAREILGKLGPQGRYIGLDQDPEALEACRELLRDFPQVTLKQANFEFADEVLGSLNLSDPNAVLLDIGTSSDQLEDPLRGFSFERDGPLDMRMDPGAPRSAKTLIHDLSKKELADLFWKLGDERYSRQFAEAICNYRMRHPIETTGQLVQAIEEALPKSRQFKKGKRPPWARRHPATRIFQALRIAVNDELGVLERSIPKLWELLAVGGRMVIISFHSLEDRQVKQFFRERRRDGSGELFTKKPVTATPEEVKENPRSRSAKLRAIRKIA